MGTLTIDGTLDVTQFWPSGESDADTTKLIVDVTPGAIRWQPVPNQPAEPTRVYDAAYVKPFGAIQPVIKDGKLTVRLQGIDAPELHVQPGSLKKTIWKGKELGSLKGLKRPDGLPLVSKYRQRQGETAVVKLAAFLAARANGAPLAVQFRSRLAEAQGPADVIDKYGRFVGNLVLDASTPDELDVNRWILEHGLAVVALYNSMQPDEIEDCVRAGALGRKAADGIVKYLAKTVPTFEPDVLYRKKNSPVVNEGARKFLHPKLYRRQCTWWSYKTAKRFTSGYDTFLGLNKDDTFFTTDDFLQAGPLSAVQIPIADLVTNGTVVYRPEQIVFKEQGSTLYAADGTKILHW